MEQKIKKFLEFNGKNMYFTLIGENWHIAIKPICEALNVNYTRQFKNLKANKILGPALANWPMQVGNDQIRNYACLPENFVYGWLFKIQSNSPELEAYQWKCYDLLFQYFHGTITQRNHLLKEKFDLETKLTNIKKRQIDDFDYQLGKHVESKLKLTKKALSNLDKEVVSNQQDLWSQN